MKTLTDNPPAPLAEADIHKKAFLKKWGTTEFPNHPGFVSDLHQLLLWFDFYEGEASNWRAEAVARGWTR